LVNDNPLFVTGQLGDYYLSQTAAGQGTDSPCVDAGSDTAANLGMDIFTTRTDLAVDTRTVDMGYHYPITNVADIDGDWDVDFADFAILASQWQQAPGIPSADIEPASGDGIVDTDDLAVLANFWLECLVFAASSPSPGDNESDVSPSDVLLSWSAGERAVYHDVYFGTDPNLVADANYQSAEFMATVSDVNFSLGSLEPETYYYWRIDEIGLSNCFARGNVWSFRTKVLSEFRASNPDPGDAAQDIHPYTSLSWTAGYGALSHDVYFGTNVVNVDNATVDSDEYMGNFDVTMYDPCGLELDMTYYWRIDESNTLLGTVKGDIWSFETRELSDLMASNPVPADGAEGVGLNTFLEFTAGYWALSHDIYLGTDFDDVNAASPDSDEYMGNFDVTMYDPCGLDFGRVYFWRIDEETAICGMVKGNVWSFTTTKLVGWWELEDGFGSIAHDSSGYGNDGTLVGEPNWVAGIIGAGAVDCNGEGDYISISSINALTGNNVTIAAWINGDNFQPGGWNFNPIVTQYNLSGQGYYLYVRGNDNKPALYFNNFEAVSSSPISTGQWYYIVGTYDGVELKIYVDGNLKGTSTATGLSGVEHNCYIGYDAADDYYFNGTIDDVQIYDRALSDESVLTLYLGLFANEWLWEQ
jgi:hypothetical protein